MKQTALLIMILTIFSKIFGFVRDITLSYFYGASSLSDAYLISLTIPMAIFGFIGTGISTGYIPMYSKIEQEYGEKESNKYTNNLINIVLCICTLVVILVLSFTEPVVKLFASGFEGETLEAAINFTKVSIFGVYFTGLVYIFNGILQIKGNYIAPALIGFPLNLFIILSIFTSVKTNSMVLAIGSFVATASQLILLIPFAYKKGFRYKYVFDIRDKYIVNMAHIAMPVIISASVNQINLLIDRTIASRIAVGGISALNYASRLNGFILGIFVSSIVTAMYPNISRMAVKNNIDGFKATVSEAISGINLLVVPASVGAIIFAKQVIILLFGRGAFDIEAISMTSRALFFYSVGMIGFGLQEVLSRAFYSFQDSKTPMINATIAVVMNIVLNLILSKFMGIGGLALATSISAIFCTGLLFISFRKKLGPFGMKQIIISFVKILVASLIMGAIAKSLFNILLRSIGANLSLIVSIIVGALFYFVIVYFLGVEEMSSIINAVKRKFKIV